MDQTFRTYKRVAECYHGKATTASELAMEAKAPSQKHWVKVRPSSKCQEGNIRREREVDGKIITEELKDDGKYDDVVVAKLMLYFETYIRSAAFKHKKSFQPEDIMFQANLALRWALEGYQPEMLSNRVRINPETGEKQKYRVLTKVKFEQVWRVIFESNIQGMFQDSNRLNRKTCFNSESLDQLQEEDNFQVSDESMDLQNMDFIIEEGKDGKPGIIKRKDEILKIKLSDQLEYYKSNKNIMAYLILDAYVHTYLKSKDGIKRINQEDKIPEGYEEEKVTKANIFRRYKEVLLKAMKKKHGDFFKVDINEKGKRVIDDKKVKLKKAYWEETKTEKLEIIFTQAFEDIKERIEAIMHQYSPESLEGRTNIGWLTNPDQEKAYEKAQKERLKTAQSQYEACQLGA